MLQKLLKLFDQLSPVTAGVGLIAGLILFGIWYNRDYLSDVVIPDEIKQGRVAISVATPTVHTRERLLNDRFEQVSWLDDELKNTRPKMPEAATAAKSTTTPSPDPGAPAEAKEADAQKLRILDELTEQIRYGADDPRKPFEMMNGYRDVLRAERARAMLDDRHDMDDNTLDLFSFDTTVMPRDGMHGSAAIEVLLTRDPSELLDDVPGRIAAEKRFGDQKFKDLFDTYVGWLEKVRNVQHSSLETLTRTLDTVDGWRFSSSDYELLLRRSACSELLRPRPNVSEARDQRRQSAEKRRDACRATLTGTTPWDLSERTVPMSSPEPDQEAHSAMQAIDRMLASVQANVLTQSAGTFLKQVRHGQELTRTGIESLNGPSDAVLAAYVNNPLRSPQEIAADCMAQSPGSTNSSVPVVQPWLVGAVKQAFPDLAAFLVFDCTTAPKNLPLRSLVALIDKLEASNAAAAVSDPKTTPKWTVDVVDGVSLSDRDLERVMTSCVAASLIEENAVRPTAEQPRNHGASLTKFFDIRVDRLVSGCSISIAPKVSSLQIPDNVSKPDEIARALEKLFEQRELLNRLDFLLEGPGYSDRPDSVESPDWPATAAYGYSLSPRLRQNVEIRRDTRTAASIEATQGSGSFTRSRGLDYRGVEPEVVGFMRSTQAERPRRGARFGWLLTPRPGKEDTYSVPLEQAELGAVVALPSWWRSALLQTCTRFVSQANMGSVFTDEFWKHKDQCRVEMVRLPGSSLEVSRRLGMDVLTTPYIDAWQTPPLLLAGATAEATQLVITGERLWRNTVVTLGGQKADRIEVLPDMVGIAATFKCIRKPTTANVFVNPVGPSVTVAPMATTSAPRPDAAPKPVTPLEPTVMPSGPVTVASPATAQKDSAPKPVMPPRSSETPTGPVTVDTTANVAAPLGATPRLIATYTVPVTVWTSEGHTAAQDAFVVADAGDSFKPCPRDPGDEKPSP